MEWGVYCENFVMIGLTADAGDHFKNRATIPLAPCICIKPVPKCIDPVFAKKPKTLIFALWNERYGLVSQKKSSLQDFERERCKKRRCIPCSPVSYSNMKRRLLPLSPFPSVLVFKWNNNESRSLRCYRRNFFHLGTLLSSWHKQRFLQREKKN